MARLSPLDASWLSIESASAPMHVGSLAVFSLPKGAKANFLHKLYLELRSQTEFREPFNCKLSLPNSPYPSWVEDSGIDIDHHFRHSALPKPGGDRELMVLVSRLHGTHLDRDRPLWECHLIEGLKGRRFALYTKMHHSMIDGVSGMRMLQSSLSEQPDGPSGAPWRKPEAKRGGKSDTVQGDFLGEIFRQMTDQIKSVPGVSRSFADLGKRALQSARGKSPVPYTAPKTNLNKRISGQRVFVVQSFGFDRIKAVSKNSGVTINDVVMALCADALRRYFIEFDTLPDDPLLANVPVSIRPEPGKGKEAGNAITTILANLATDISDPLERLRAVHDSMDEGKKRLKSMSKAEVANFTILVNLPFILGQIVGTAGRARPMYNLVISNVPGPQNSLYMNGARMEALYPMSLIFNGQALNITVTTYAGSLDFGFTACRRRMPKVTQMPRYVNEALDSLEKALK